MGTAENKQRMIEIFEELATGNTAPFRDAMDEDFIWIVMGSTPWSGTYRGRSTVLDELMAPLFAQFVDRYTNSAECFIAEGDRVVVQCSGRATTRTGVRYDNSYCYVCRLADGRLREITEYLDTELVSSALAPPRAL